MLHSGAGDTINPHLYRAQHSWTQFTETIGLSSYEESTTAIEQCRILDPRPQIGRHLQKLIR